MRRSRLPRALRLCLGPSLLGVACNAQQASPPTAEELLGEVVTTYRIGDLKGSWDAFESFLEHPSRNELHIDAFMNCFYSQRCPQVGALGRILGIPRTELATRIEGFCPRLRSPEVEADMRKAGIAESDIGEYRQIYPRIVENGLNGTCASWRQEQQDLMFSDPRPAVVQPEALPLAWYERQHGGFGTAIETVVGSVPLRLGVDSGSSLGSLSRRSTTFPDLEIEISDRHMYDKGIFAYLISKPASVASLRVGRTLHQPFGLNVIDHGLLFGHYPTSRNGNLGMTFLLTYAAVCFAWDEHRLHLGALGPCAHGAQPYDAHLFGRMRLRFNVRALDGTWFAAGVDTGAPHTNCSAAFSKANGGRSSFSFGKHPYLRAECVFDDAVLFKSADYGFSQVEIRMNDLLRFSAFGWQLNPLRVYFVPRDEVNPLPDKTNHE